jgi:hypothetical protein
VLPEGCFVVECPDGIVSWPRGKGNTLVHTIQLLIRKVKGAVEFNKNHKEGVELLLQVVHILLLFVVVLLRLLFSCRKQTFCDRRDQRFGNLSDVHRLDKLKRVRN